MRLDKSMGPDGLAPKLLLETKDLISYPLNLLFEESLHDTVGNYLLLHQFLKKVIEIELKTTHRLV